MKILRLSPYYYPEITASSHLLKDIDSTFIDNGINIDIITPTPCRGISNEIRRKYKSRLYEQFYDGKLSVRRFKMFKEGVNPMQRALRYFLCGFKYYSLGISIAKKVDVINIGSTPPIMGAIAVLIKKRVQKPIIYNLQDIFPDSLISTGLAKKNSVFWMLGRKLENFTYRNVDKIIVPCEDFRSNIVKKGVPSEKIEVIYNWIDYKSVVPIPKERNPLFDELCISRQKFHVVYAGNLGLSQNVTILLEAANILKQENDIEFLVFGSGGLKEDYEEFAEREKLNNIKFFPLQPLRKVSQVYSLADVSLVSCKKGAGGSAMPSKTWSILSTGTPILCSFDSGGELQYLVENFKFGLFSQAEDTVGLVYNIKKLYSDRKLCQEYGINGRKFIEENLTKEVGTSKYLRVFKTFNQ